MTDYRIYQVDDEGHIKGLPFEIACDTDEQAIEHARQYVDGPAVEVRNRAWRVKRLDSKE